MKQIKIDGSQGEGGGQVLRSSLALSLLTGKPFTIEKIRENRRKPGLMRQHLTAVEAAMEVGNCRHGEAKIGSRELRFTPNKVKGGDYRFRVGTAGSATLVLQTVLPALMLAKEPSSLVLSGGTHNPMAPPFDFLQKVFLPILARLGPKVETEIKRYGFYPAGGGEFRVRIDPVEKMTNLELFERGNPVAQIARVLISKLPDHIAERERETFLKKTVLDESDVVIERIENSPGPGNVVMLECEFENVTEIFTGFGEVGVSAENVCNKAVQQYRRYVSSPAPVDEYLADQLLLPLGVAAHRGAGKSVFETTILSQHSMTHIDVLERFLDINIETKTHGKNRHTVMIDSR